MPLIKDRLPEPRSYFEGVGLRLGRGHKWVTAPCVFHGGSDSLRINLHSGAFVCMAGCGARGGDVLAYHQAANGLGFIEAAKALGAWENDPNRPQYANPRPAPFTARQALQVLASDLTYCAICLGNAANGVTLSDADRLAFMEAVGRVLRIKEMAV